MLVKLIRHTPEPDELCGEAAALCTAFEGDPLKALNGAMSRGHRSVSEHASFTFYVDGVSRALLAQLTRHRVASYSVQSQRYVRMDGMPCVVPETVKANEDLYFRFKHLVREINEWYISAVQQGVPKEDARYITPQGACTEMIFTMNTRELLHFFELRTCNRAQWEIRELADLMLAECKVVAPELFKRAGCACMKGLPCPEGKASCGKPRGGKA